MTLPSGTPRKRTAEPCVRPSTDPSKKTTALRVTSKNVNEPKTNAAVTSKPIAARTKPPTIFGFARRLMLPLLGSLGFLCRGGSFAPPQKSLNFRIRTFSQQPFWGAAGDLRLGLRIEKDAVITNRKDAWQLVRNHNDCGAETVAQLEDQIVQKAGTYRIETGRWLVEQQHFRRQRHRAGETGALLHSSADLGRKIILEAGEPDQGKLQGCEVGDLGRLQIGILLKRQRDILGQRHRAPQPA